MTTTNVDYESAYVNPAYASTGFIPGEYRRATNENDESRRNESYNKITNLQSTNSTDQNGNVSMKFSSY